MNGANATVEFGVTLKTRDGRSVAFACGPEERMLDAAERQDLYPPAQCGEGSCGACLAYVVSGEVEREPSGPSALPDRERAKGGVLLCRCRPLSDVELSAPYDAAMIRFEPEPERDAVIEAIEVLSAPMRRLVLRLGPGRDGGTGVDFEPGQYLELTVPGTDLTRAYSIASTPNWDGRVELLIRLQPGGRFGTWLNETAAPGMRLVARGPRGAFVLRDRGLDPRWFVAGGSGLAPVLSMLRRMAEWGDPQPARLFYGTWRPDEQVCQDELTTLQSSLPGLEIVRTVANPGTEPGAEPNPSWAAGTGSVVNALSASLEAASRQGEPLPDIYVCGSSGMVEAIRAAAVKAGLPEDRVFHEQCGGAVG
ncbi:2Fe-2S iron-sulfur cluster-binding protein [Skermanella stibiiresistens]|uniref:2Fe-2S iron-sulfur cluster-binding protein n=1 Tax=Skermanella stibiiresistens TaxID=913326 RepID=UPI0004B21919|nr:2Fe-2S iron-sulfur cluster binding domain-containing protein [Skermanella stibiiresistens]